MDQNRISILETTSNGDRRLRDLIEESQAFGIIAMLMGVSQVLLSLSFIDPGPLLTKSSWVGIVFGAGGWLLIGIGMNVFQSRESFDGGWIDSGWVTWLWLVIILILTVGVAVATVWVVLS